MKGPIIYRKVGESIITSRWLVQLVAVSESVATITVSSFEFGTSPDFEMQSAEIVSTVECSIDEVVTIDECIPFRLQLCRLGNEGAVFVVDLSEGRVFAELEKYWMYQRAEPETDFFQYEKMTAAEKEEARRKLQREHAAIQNYAIPRDYAAKTDLTTHYRIEEIENDDGTIGERVVALKDEFDERGNVKPKERPKIPNLDERLKDLAKYFSK